MDLLDLAIINGEQISNGIFQKNPMLLENLITDIKYPKEIKDRDINQVFKETNDVKCITILYFSTM